MIPRTTVARSSERVEGWQLDRDQPSSVRFHPAPSGTGVVFARKDLPGAPEVSCRLEHVTAWSRWSGLETGGVAVHHTEHLLAAVAGLGVDDVLVELSADRIPVVSGGSCVAFSTALAGAGLTRHSEPRRVLRLKRPLEWSVELDQPAGTTGAGPALRRVLGVPASRFSATYLFHVPAIPGLRAGVAEFDEAQDQFADSLADARTYYLQSEEQNLAGLLSRARTDYIVLEASSSQELVDEVARHKLVDFWGDLRLLGLPLWGSFAAFRTGHKFHHDLLRKLVNEDYLESIELSESRTPYDDHP